MDTAAPDVSEFTLPHAEVILEGHVGSRLLLVSAAARRRAIADDQGRVHAVARARRFGLRVGQFKIPYGLQRWTYSGELEFVTISTPMQAFTLERDIGLMAIGRPFAGRLEYELSVTNGSGAGRLNDNIDLAYAARIVAAPLGPVTPGEGRPGMAPAPARLVRRGRLLQPGADRPRRAHRRSERRHGLRR